MNAVTGSILWVDFDCQVAVAVLEVNQVNTQDLNFNIAGVFMS
ncbi:hypothetical protein [Nostoc sp. ChiQUE01b]|nr:hypothetical protein [Nostoc sp. ChiQUE01b]MDZ8257206.1 hypothetical protein [Nostoc sp. ChiQUE01b]